MNVHEYLIESEKTERKFEGGAVVDGEMAVMTQRLLDIVLNASLLLNLIKKNLVYGKPKEEMAEQWEEYTFRLATAWDGYIPDDDVELSQDKMEVLHAALGIVTETAELIPPLAGYIFRHEPLDTVHVAEEFGDFHWFQGIILRKFVIDPKEMLERNIEKLRVRYPNKFTSEDALNRDLESERKVLEGESNPSNPT